MPAALPDYAFPQFLSFRTSDDGSPTRISFRRYRGRGYRAADGAVFRARRMPAAVMALLGLLCRDEARWKDWPTAYITFRVTLLLFRL